MIRFLQLDPKVRKKLLAKLQAVIPNSLVFAGVVSFLEEMEPEDVVGLARRMDWVEGVGDVLREVTAALCSTPPSGGDWRTSPRNSRRKSRYGSRRKPV